MRLSHMVQIKNEKAMALNTIENLVDLKLDAFRISVEREISNLIDQNYDLKQIISGMLSNILVKQFTVFDLYY